MKNCLFIFVLILVSSFKHADVTIELDPLNIDVELIKQNIVKVINEGRIRSNKNLIRLDPSLDSIVNYFSHRYENKKLHKRKKKLKRGFYEISRNYAFFNSWFKVGYTSLLSLYDNGRSYTLIEEEGRYCYGTKNQIKDTVIIRKPLPLYSYKLFAKNLLRKTRPSRNKWWISNPEVSKIGINIRVIKKDYPKIPPKIELLFVISGNVLPQNLK